MRRLPLAHRLVIFWLAATVAMLVLAGLLYLFLRDQQEEVDTRGRLEAAMVRLDLELDQRGSRVADIGRSLSAERALVATLNLFHNYFDANAGRAELFDYPAQELASLLGEATRTAGLDWVLVSGRAGPIAGHAGGDYLYWSHRPEGTQAFATTSESAPYGAVPAPGPLVSLQHHPEGVHLEACPSGPGLALGWSQAIAAPDGTSIGRIALGRCLKQDLADLLNREQALEFAILGNGRVQSAGMPAGPLPASEGGSVLPGSHHWLGSVTLVSRDEDRLAIAEAALADGGMGQFAFAQRGRRVAEARGLSLVAAGIVSLVAVTLVVMAVALAYLRGRITRPIERLAAAARAGQQGRFEAVTGIPPGNEVAELAEVFNEMTRRIRERDALVQEEIAERRRVAEALALERTHLRTLVATIPDLVWLKDAKGVYLACNPRFEQLYGRSAGEIVGRTDEELVGGPWSGFLRDQDQAARVAGGPVVGEERLTFATDGYSGLFEVTQVPMVAADGSVIGVLGIGHDITLLKSALDELASHRTRLEQLVGERTAELQAANSRLSATQFAMDSVGIGIHWIEVDSGQFLYVNRQAAAMLGYTPEEMVRLAVFDIDADHPKDKYGEIRDLIREKGYVRYESTQKARDGRLIPVEANVYYHPGDDRTAPRFIAFVTDITRRKEAEQALRQAKEAAEAANRAKSAFLANMSHELRTPLNAILGFSDILRRDPALSEAQQQNLDIIHRSGDHLLSLINDVLDMAKIEAGRAQVQARPLDLGALVLEVVDVMRVRAEDKGLQLLLDQSSRFPRYVVGDETKLRQILINLLSNAVKATDRGGVTLRLGVSGEGADRLTLEVEDTGIGIAPEDQARIFEAFVQVGSSGRQQGTGLGLAITRQFVELLGGRISLTSAVGQGSTFRVELPAVLARAEDLPATESHGEVTGLEPGQPAWRVLVVEDQLENRLLLVRLLESVGFTVQAAEDGAGAVAICQRWQPHFIWMDRRMPVMDGLEATRQIRALPGGGQVKIAAATASSFREEDEKLVAAGFDAIVHKPFRPEQIYEVMSRLLGVRFSHASAPEAEPADLEAALDLSPLPAGRRAALQRAARLLDAEGILAFVGELRQDDPERARQLAALVAAYRFDRIEAACATVPSPRSP